MTIVVELPSTKSRLVIAALRSFATRGYEATSLDEVAAEAGVRKQTLLYHHPSKEALLGAVIEFGVAELFDALRPSMSANGGSIDAVVAALFRLGTRRPELLDLVREVLRLGPPASTRLRAEAEPLLTELSATVPRSAVVGAAAIVIGMATEVEVARSLGLESSLGELRRRRRILLTYLHDAAR